VNRTLARAIAIGAAALALFLPLFAGDYPLQVARNVMMYMALAVTWDMLLRSGQISFGIAGLFGVGSYATILGVVRGGMPDWLSIPFAGLFSGLVAFLIGLLYDTTLPESFGLHAFIFVLIAFGADQFRKPFESESAVSKVLTLLLANIIFHLVGLLVLGVVYSFDAQLVRLTGIAFLYNFAVSFVAFWLMQFMSRLRLVVVRD
jgi:rod shape-determining protein MreD